MNLKTKSIDLNVESDDNISLKVLPLKPGANEMT